MPEAGALIDAEGGQVALIEQDRAAVGRHQPDDHVEGGGLAGAVGAEQADHLAGVDLERQVVHHLARAVALAEQWADQPRHFPANPDVQGVGEREWMVPRTRLWLSGAASAWTR